jgi:hypothetical protein
MAKLVKIEQPIEVVIKEYDTLREQEKKCKERKKYLSEIIKDYAFKNGTKDDKGNYYTERDGFMLGKQCKKTITLDHEKSIAFLKANSSTAHCVVTTEVVDEEAVAKCVEQGEITQEDLDTITNIKIDYSVSLTPKVEMPEIEQQEIQLQKSAQVRRRR